MLVFAQDTMVYNHCHIYFLLDKLHGVKSKLENHLQYQRGIKQALREVRGLARA